MKLMAISDIRLFPFQIKKGRIVNLINIQVNKKPSQPLYAEVTVYSDNLYDIEIDGYKVNGLNTNDFVLCFDEIDGWKELMASISYDELRDLDRSYFNDGLDGVKKVIKEFVMRSTCQ